MRFSDMNLIWRYFFFRIFLGTDLESMKKKVIINFGFADRSEGKKHLYLFLDLATP